MSGDLGARLRVDLEALAYNFQLIRSLARPAETAPVLKADAYGLGLEAVGDCLSEAGAEGFFVARVFEGERLRACLRGRPGAIFVLDGCPEGAGPRLQASGLTPVLNSRDQISAWTGSGGRLEAAALHVDTGMNRLGLRPEEAEALAHELKGLRPRLLISHLACAGETDHPMTRRQAESFAAVRALFPRARASIANTEAIFLHPDLRLDLVRPGLGVYGGGPGEPPVGPLRTVATLEAPILQIRRVPAGETIGYGAAARAMRELQVAVLAAGHADVLRAEPGRGYGWLGGGPRPFLGRLSMDLIALDVTDCPEARVGRHVEIFGPNLPLSAAARAAGSTPYELLARSDRRLRTLSGAS